MVQPGDHKPDALTQAEIDAAKQKQHPDSTDKPQLGGHADDGVHDSTEAALQHDSDHFNPPARNFTSAATDARVRSEFGSGVPFTQAATLQVGEQRLTGALSGNRLVTPEGQYQVQANGRGGYDVRPMDASGRVDPGSRPVEGTVTFERPLDQPMSTARPQNQRFDATPPANERGTAGDTARPAMQPANPHQVAEQENIVKPKPTTVAEAPVNPATHNDDSARPGAILNTVQNPHNPNSEAINPLTAPQHTDRPAQVTQFNPPTDRAVQPTDRPQAPLNQSGDRPATVPGPHNDIRPLPAANVNPLAPGTDVRVVPVNPAGLDGRVQHIAVEMNIKAGQDGRPGLVPSDMTRLTDTGKLQPHLLDVAKTIKGGESPLKGGLTPMGDGGAVGRGVADGAAWAQRGGIPGLNLADAQNRQFLTGVIGQLQTERLGTFDPRSQNLSDILKGMDPGRMGALQNFFTHMTAAGTRPGVLTGEMMIARLTGLLNTQDATTRAHADLAGMRGGGIRETAGGQYLTELTRNLGAINRQFGMENTGNALTLTNLLGRSMGDQGAGNMVARLLPGQENIVRNILDAREGTALRLAGKDTTQQPAERAIDRAIGTRQEGTGKAEPLVPGKDARIEAGRETANTEAQATRVTDAAAAAAASAKKDDTADGELRPDAEDEKNKDKDIGKAEEPTKKHEEADQQAEQETAHRAALAALLAARQLRDDKEKETKEKESPQEKDKRKEEEGKRRRYIVKEKDTLQSIASRQLRDIRLAPLILQINRAVIPVTVQRGREVVNLKVGTSIWLPSMTEIKEFRGRLASATLSAPKTEQKFTSTEEELATKYGANWSGGTKAPAVESTAAATPQSESAPPAIPTNAEAELMADAVAAAKTRRENVERLLGPIGQQQQQTGDRIRYVIRLGDTLKSVAMKHPALQDISLWKLIARMNEMTEDTDERGMPLAKLSRGTILALPTVTEIEEFKASHRTGQAPARDSDLQSVVCTTCGTNNAAFATTCSECSSELRAIEGEPAAESESGPDAATILLQAAGFVSERKQDDSEST